MGASGQVFTIIDGNVIVCDGTLTDSGGEGGGGYTDNEDNTLQICPGTPGSSITLEWTAFNLSTDGSGGGDQFEVYDGPDLGSPLIGVLNGNTGPANISATFGNTSGCITLRFISNEMGVGSFTAITSCFIPCAPPVAAASITGSSIPAMVCLNETVNFDGTGSTAAAGFSITSYEWDFQDGSDPVGGATASHSFGEPGEYVVSLLVTDDNGCESTSPVDVRVWVSTTPTFGQLTVSDTVVCQGEEVILNGVVNSPTWTNLPQPFIEGLTPLPDGGGVSYTSPLAVSGFPASTLVTQVTDVTEVCMVMEHSYVGDLLVYLTSPSGAQVLLFDGNTANPLNTYLGSPYDDGEPPGGAGEGWLYCFSNIGALLTLGEEITAGNTTPSGVPEFGSAIPGNYTSQEGFGEWAGSSVNGTWTLTITDDQFADDGYIFEWWVAFNPSLYPDLISFTPHYGPGADSTYWSGADITELDPNGDLATVVPSAVGVNSYVYTAVNDFGCSFDTTITITVNPGVPGPILITGDELVCEGDLAYLSAPPGFTSYNWSTGAVGQNISTQEGGTITVTVGLGDCTLASEPFTVGQSPSPTPVITGPSSGCGGGNSTLTTTEQYASYAWSNGSTDPSIAVGTGTYSVIVTAIGSSCTGSSAPYSVTVGSDPQANFSMAPPSPQGIGTTVVFTDASTGNGSPLTDWAWEFGIPGQGSSSPSTSFTYNTPGNYSVTLTVTAADGCQDVLTIPYIILPEQIIIPNVFTPNGDANNEYFVIENGQFFSNTLAVYNRWGQPVFDAKNYRNTWRAADVVDGTYYYVFTTLDDNKEYTGHVTILR